MKRQMLVQKITQIIQNVILTQEIITIIVQMLEITTQVQAREIITQDSKKEDDLSLLFIFLNEDDINYNRSLFVHLINVYISL